MKTLVWDTETRGLNPELGETAFCAGAKWLGEKKVGFFDFRQPGADQDEFVDLLRSADAHVGHNIKFDLRQAIRTFNLPPDFFKDVKIYDTLLMAKYHHPKRMKFGLDDMLPTVQGLPDKNIAKTWLKKNAGKGNTKKYDLLPDEVLVPYTASDVVRTEMLFRQMGGHKGVRCDGNQLDHDIFPTVLATEIRGVAMDPVQLQAVQEAQAAQERRYREMLPFPVTGKGSRGALVDYFGGWCERWKFYSPVTGKPSVSERALQFFVDRGVEHADTVLRWRYAAKMLNSFVKSWNRYVPLGRLYPTYNIGGARTGRMSSSNPNFQQVPKRKDNSLRRVIVPDEGKVFVVADYCVAPHTRIAMVDLSWKEARDIKVHDQVIGFDESPGRDQKYRPSLVVGVKEIVRPCYRLVTSVGTVICSSDHMWAVKKRVDSSGWIRTEDVQTGKTELRQWVTPWDEDRSYDGGWLGGFWDGEGNVHSNCGVAMSQKPGPVLNRALGLLDREGMQYSLGTNKSGVVNIRLQGDSSLKFAGRFRPERLMPKARKFWENKRTWGENSRPVAVYRKEFLGNQKVIAIETTTKTYIAEGLLSHNCQMEDFAAALASGDAKYLAACSTGDVHRGVAADIFNVEFRKVTDKQRDMGKTVNHAIKYGVGAGKLSGMLKCSFSEAQSLIDKYWKQYATFNEWAQSNSRFAERGIPGKDPFGRMQFAGWKVHALTNYLIQGWCATIMKRTVRKLAHRGLVPWLYLHDEIGLQCEPQVAEDVGQLLAECMVEHEGYRFPVEVSVARENWGQKEVIMEVK